MRSQLRRIAAGALTRGKFNEYEEEILAALTQESGQADPEQISRIVESSMDSVPFYRRLAPSVSSLEDLPVVDKAMIQSNPHDFLMEDVDLSVLVSRSTSGSTGVPFTVYVDSERANRNKAGAAAGLKYAGGNAFDPIVRAKQWGTIPVQERFLHFLKEYYTAEADQFRASDALSITKWIKRRKNTIIQGYPSYLEMIFRTMEKNEISFPPDAVSTVISAAEAPTPYFFEVATRLFGVAPHARYSNMELGAMSISSNTSHEIYKFDISSFHVEILAENSDDPVPHGEIGRIVVTDLHNRSMPLLRYDTGDLGRFGATASGQKACNTVVDLHGRRLDVLIAGTASNPRRMHPLGVWARAAVGGEVRQFQLKQRDVGRFTWILNADRSSHIEKHLRKVLDERVGDIIECDFEYVSEMPTMSSGKRKIFVTEIEDPLGYISEQK